MHPLTDVASPSRLTVAVPHALLAVGAVNDGVAVHSIVALPPADPIIGNPPVSGIVCETVVERLPQASIAYQLLVMVVLQALPDVISGEIAMTVAPLHASLAVGGVNDGVALQSIIALLPACPITGGVVSTILIVCETVAL